MLHERTFLFVNFTNRPVVVPSRDVRGYPPKTICFEARGAAGDYRHRLVGAKNIYDLSFAEIFPARRADDKKETASR
jgi:hypothetical protein